MKKILLLLTVLSLASCGFNNPETNQGEVGYVYTVPLIWGKSEFVTTQVGPTSSGLGWRLYVLNLDAKVMTFDEKFDIMSKDQLLLSFAGHLQMRIDSDRTKEIVEKYGEWYSRRVQQVFRNFVYEKVAQRNAFDVHLEREKIGQEVFLLLKNDLKNCPFVVEKVIIGNIQFPPIVTASVNEKIAADQQSQKMQFILTKETQEAQRKRIEAQGIADFQQIVTRGITEGLLTWKGIEATETIAKSPNTKIIIVGNPKNGLPLILGNQ